MFRRASRNASNASVTNIVSPSCRRYSSPPHFYSNKQLELHASKKANRLSLRQLVWASTLTFTSIHLNLGLFWTFDDGGASHQGLRLDYSWRTRFIIFQSANYVRTELPVRIAHRIRDMQSLPYSVVTEENVGKIYAVSDASWRGHTHLNSTIALLGCIREVGCPSARLLYVLINCRLRNYPQVVTRQDNDRFCEFLRTILGEQ